jgi:predicted transcriptional regulator
MLFGVKFILDGSAEVLLQPARFKIWNLLKESGRAMYVEEISKKTGIHPRMVSHHIDVLESEKLVVTRYEIRQDGPKRGIAVRLCELAPHAAEVVKDIKESI